MGGPERQVILDGFSPNGLLPSETASVACVLDRGRCLQAEERTAELIARIQPNQPSEERRNAVASYVQRLIMKCFSCQVFTFGSVPLKTYLPDGDIDLTAFSNNQNLKDSWALEVRDILENEEKSGDAEFCVKDVQYIQAEVKIVKCLVENIVVDISLNQLGGLCTLCFLEEVDNLVSNNHLFKRSIILIKAWCYYESRILGAHHGLISTYALETLVLYIFHVYNNTFAGPFEVLYRFLEFFSKFDWDNYCLSLWGPVPIRSLPNIRAEPPRKDCGELLLNSLFLNACGSVYAVMPNNQENQEQPFVSKYFNIVDPLRANNNLGRSVSKGNFFRIRSAFALGAQQLLRLLDCPEENILAELDFFFRNTWDRHGKGQRPDAPYVLYTKNEHTIERLTCHELEVGKAQESHASDVSAVSNTLGQHANGTVNPIMTSTSNQTSSMNTFTDKGQNPNYSSKEVDDTRDSARVHSSPESAQISGEVHPQHRHIGKLETDRGQVTSSITDKSKISSSRSKILEKQSNRVSADDQQSSWQTSNWRTDDAFDSKSSSYNYYNAFGLDGGSVGEMMRMHQEEQDYFNITSPYNSHNFNGYLQAPVSANSTDHPFPVPPPVFAPGFSHANSFGVLPENGTYFEYPWGQNVHYSQGLVPFAATQYFPSVGMMLNQEEIIEPVDDNLEVSELNHEDSYGGFWSEQDVNYMRRYGYEYGNIQAQHLKDKQMFASGDSDSSSSWLTNYYGYPSKDFGTTIENKWLTRENYDDDPPDERIVESDANSASSRLAHASHSASRTKLSSGSSSEGSPSTLTRDEKVVSSTHPTQPTALCENQYEGKLVDRVSSKPDDNREWNNQSTVDTDFAESTTAETVISDVQTHQSTSYARGPNTTSNLAGPAIHPFVGPGSRHKAVDDQGLMPLTFYPTGPPFPFFTMVPFYGLPTETMTSYAATSHRDVNAELGNHHARQSNVNLGSTVRFEKSDASRKYNSMKHDATSESLEEQRSDILHSDFASHWQNLQYGRFCQNAQLQGPLLHPPPVFVPATQLQGQFPLDGPGRSPVNINIMPRKPHGFPRMPIQRAYDSHLGIGPHFPNELPRFRGGTGTYLPNPRLIKNRHYTNTRNHRESYSYDWNGEREGNWNYNSKPRSGNRSQFRYQVERQGTRMDKTNPSYRRSDKSWNSYKNGSFSSYNAHYGSYNSSVSNNHVTAGVPYGMQSLSVAPINEISPFESAVPPIVMLYPYNQNVSCDSNEWHDYGSLRPVHRTGTNKASHQGEILHVEEGNCEETSTDND